jgi:hypothetical protein
MLACPLEFTMVLLRVSIAIAFLAPSAGCERRPASGDDDATADDDAADDDAADDDTSDDDDETPTPPPPETDCEDGLDNDEDGVSDCDDSDCAAVWRCTWPHSVQHTASLHYDANALAELAGYDDCDTQISSPMSDAGANPACPACDRTFTGLFTYTLDTCPTDPDNPRPTSGAYGLVFVDTASRTVFGQDDAGSWVNLGVATDASGSGTYTLVRTDPVEVESFDAGTLQTTLTFTDL